MNNRRVYITAHESATALGSDKTKILEALSHSNPLPVIPDSGDIFFKPYYVIPDSFKKYSDKSRSAAIAFTLFDRIKPFIEKYTSIPLFVSTSTGGIDATEHAYSELLSGTSEYSVFQSHFFNRLINDLNAHYNNAFKEAMTFSTACSSSGHAIIQAYRMIKAGLIDRAVVLGIDILSHTTMIGFDSLQLISPTGSKPLTELRDGITLGEGAGLLVLESEPSKECSFEVVGAASSSDGHHISSPDPEGKSQKSCILDAINQAGITPEDITYISAHGTGTVMNDQVEIKTLRELFGSIPVTSLKSYIGHTLGASSVDEISICILQMEQGKIYQPSRFEKPMDEMIPEKTIDLNVRYFIKNSFGFGGNNISIVIKNNN